MNIAFYSHYFTPEIGAPSARIYDLSKQWHASGHKVEVVTCFPNHPVGKVYNGYTAGLYAHEILDGIPVHRNWSYITPNKGFLKKTIGHVSFLPSAVLLSNRQLHCPQVAIGSSPTFFAAMAAAMAGIQFKIPFVMEVRDLWPAIFVDLGVLKNRIAIKWLERLEMYLYRRAIKIVTVTEAFRNNIIERGISPKKIHTIPNGADVDYWKPEICNPKIDELRFKLGLEGCFVVLYIGAHGISHALGRILDSARLLKTKDDIRFVFVGEGAEKEDLVHRVKELNLKNIVFHSPVDKAGVKKFYEISDICLVPLRNIPLFEIFIPSKMFEIMAMQKPIVASLRGEAAAILNRSGSAIVVEPEDSSGIAEAILSLYQNKNRSKKLGERGRKFVVDEFSRRTLAGKYLEVLQEAIEVFEGT